MSLSHAVCDRMIRMALLSIEAGSHMNVILQRQQKSMVSTWFEEELHRVFSLSVLGMVAANRHTVLYRDVPPGFDNVRELKSLQVPRASVYACLKRYASQASEVLSKLCKAGENGVVMNIRMSSSVIHPLTLLSIEGTLQKIKTYLISPPLSASIESPVVTFGPASSDKIAGNDESLNIANFPPALPPRQTHRRRRIRPYPPGITRDVDVPPSICEMDIGNGVELQTPLSPLILERSQQEPLVPYGFSDDE